MRSQKFNRSYVGPRHDLAALVPADPGQVLDVGCSVGELGEYLKRVSGATVTGIEIDSEMASVAAERLDKVIVGDVERLSLEDLLSTEQFDCLILGDVLEHLRDPWAVLSGLGKFLRPGATVVASIPNVRHYTTILSLALGGYWPYRERGIHDRGHLRFFTLKNIKEMFQNAGLGIIGVTRKYRIIERPHRYNTISKYFACPPFRDFLTFQYLIIARKPHEDLDSNPGC